MEVRFDDINAVEKIANVICETVYMNNTKPVHYWTIGGGAKSCKDIGRVIRNTIADPPYEDTYLVRAKWSTEYDTCAIKVVKVK
jgi:hypothetical protein